MDHCRRAQPRAGAEGRGELHLPARLGRTGAADHWLYGDGEGGDGAGAGVAVSGEEAGSGAVTGGGISGGVEEVGAARGAVTVIETGMVLTLQLVWRAVT